MTPAKIHVGNIRDRAGIEAAAEAIVRIMNVQADQKTIREGIRALSSMAEVRNVSISNVRIDGDNYVQPSAHDGPET